MRVYDVNLTSTAAGGSARAQETQGASQAGTNKAGSQASGGNGDRVELSSTLGSLSQALATSGSERASRVQALASLYQSGQYQPSSMATSRAMVSDSLAAGAKSL